MNSIMLKGIGGSYPTPLHDRVAARMQRAIAEGETKLGEGIR
jgi:hypothetical protein